MTNVLHETVNGIKKTTENRNADCFWYNNDTSNFRHVDDYLSILLSSNTRLFSVKQ